MLSTIVLANSHLTAMKDGWSQFSCFHDLRIFFTTVTTSRSALLHNACKVPWLPSVAAGEGQGHGFPTLQLMSSSSTCLKHWCAEGRWEDMSLMTMMPYAIWILETVLLCSEFRAGSHYAQITIQLCCTIYRRSRVWFSEFCSWLEEGSALSSIAFGNGEHLFPYCMTNKCGSSSACLQLLDWLTHTFW